MMLGTVFARTQKAYDEVVDGKPPSLPIFLIAHTPSIISINCNYLDPASLPIVLTIPPPFIISINWNYLDPASHFNRFYKIHMNVTFGLIGYIIGQIWRDL